MAFRLFDFECEKCWNVFEDMVQPEIQILQCPLCSGTANRLIASPRIDWLHMGVDPGFPSAYEKWAKAKTVHHKTGKETMHGGKGTSLLMY